MHDSETEMEIVHSQAIKNRQTKPEDWAKGEARKQAQSHMENPNPGKFLECLLQRMKINWQRGKEA